MPAHPNRDIAKPAPPRTGPQMGTATPTQKAPRPIRVSSSHSILLGMVEEAGLPACQK